MRTITDHKLNGLNEALTITVLDEPSEGGASNHYRIEGHSIDLNPSAGQNPVRPGDIFFQNGPLQESDVNGISGEALLAIVIDRLRCFQSGKFSCKENSVALTHLETALLWLQKRTRDRLARGVEGTYQN